MERIHLAKGWKDYVLLDCGDGYKLEGWRGIRLIRPDSQVLWPVRDRTIWGEYHARYDPASLAGKGSWKERRAVPSFWEMRYGDLKFKVKLTAFKHTGLFPEQAVQWEWMREKIRERRRRVTSEIRILNLFGYTGASSLACAREGALVTHVDASKGTARWCKENIRLGEGSGERVRILVDDVFKFVHREIRRGKVYEGIIMDPPSFGRGTTGELWKIEKHLWALLQACKGVLSQRPLFMVVNVYKMSLSTEVLHNLLRLTMRDFKGVFETGELGLPIEGSSLNLPCGIFVRWEAGV